ncbi:MAG: DUF4249 family protein [Bacteroidetes bacterium]|nr:DUF4249 family protein [Bacteroidota bacterium]
MRLLKYFIYLLIFGLFTSCTEKVDVQLGKTAPVVVIEGYIATEVDSSYVRLSLTQDYFNPTTPVYIDNGTVEITDDKGNSLVFTYAGEGKYKGPAGYIPDTSTEYSLRVVVDGKEYTAKSMLYPMFDVDPILEFKYQPASGFLSEGYSVTYYSTDNRPGEIYTRFNFGQNDTIFDQEILFSSKDIKKNQRVPFELPFYRPQSGDSVIMQFRSIDIPVARYLEALSNLNSGAPGPFQTPPANPPTNISGGAVGYFMCTDVVRIGQKIP